MQPDASLLLSLGFHQQAIDAFSLQLQSKEDYSTLIKRAVAYTQLQKLTEARSDLKKAIALSPENFEAYLQLGISFTQPLSNSMTLI